MPTTLPGFVAPVIIVSCLAFVRELAARGAKKVYAGVRSPDALAEEFAGLPAGVVPLDVTDPAASRGPASRACCATP
jgi:NAD(P)-dependent dehydrogenase (short-subunit alcohol dehydrogenase family)